MKLKNKPIVVLGDIHGAWGNLLFDLKLKNIEDVNIISVGDLGVGFNGNKASELEICEEVNTRLQAKKIHFYGIRGNHDKPQYFSGPDRISLSNFELLEDFTVAEYQNQKLQFIGGAISIDRTGRKEGISYWEKETVEYRPEACQKVDILVTHTAPSWCFPQQFNEMVYGWAKEDAYLLQDLSYERSVMDEMFKLCDPSKHFYGHFHASRVEKINSCEHRLLGIDELYMLP
jgi:predicted phosphodiesterase